MAKGILLRNGDIAIVDDCDAERINSVRWRLGNTGYAFRATKSNGEGRTILMHREVLGLTDGDIHTDHINGNKLDNRRCNLRPVTAAQNAQNIKSRESKSGLRNVYSKAKSFEVHLQANGTYHYIGSFKNADEANAAAIKARRELLPFAVDEPVSQPPTDVEILDPPQILCSHCGDATKASKAREKQPNFCGKQACQNARYRWLNQSNENRRATARRREARLRLHRASAAV